MLAEDFGFIRIGSVGFDVDADDYAHAAYWIANDYGDFIRTANLFVAPNDDLYISDEDGEGVKYVFNSSGEWIANTIDERRGNTHSDSPGLKLSMDDLGFLHGIYCIENWDYQGTGIIIHSELYYATNKNGDWESTWIADREGDRVWISYSMELDAEGNVHILYNKGEGRKYLTNRSGDWVTEDVPTDKSSDGSKALSSSGAIYICQPDEGIHVLTNESGDWVMETAYPGSGNSCSLVLDSNDKVHLSFNVPGEGLKYATNLSGDWETQTVLIEESSGNYYASTIATDALNHPHIGFARQNTYLVRYAFRSGGEWKIAEIDHVGHYDFDLSMKLDSTGKIHMAYDTAGALWHASFPKNYIGDE